MVDRQQKHRFEQLRLYRGTFYRHERFVREDRRSLGHGVNVAIKFEIREILQKFLAELVLGAQIFDVILAEMELFQKFYHLRKPRRDGKSAVVGNFSEKHIEICNIVLHSALIIAVRHGELIKVAQHGVVRVVLPE